MTRIESDGSDDLGEISVEVEDNLDAYHTNGSLDEEYTDNIVETANHGNGDDGDEYLYGGLDDLKKMISEESSGVDDDYLDEGADYELLAEFSDVDDASEDDEANFMDAVREANNFKSARRRGRRNMTRKLGNKLGEEGRNHLTQRLHSFFLKRMKHLSETICWWQRGSITMSLRKIPEILLPTRH